MKKGERVEQLTMPMNAGEQELLDGILRQGARAAKASSDAHLCHAEGCTKPIPPKLAMCGKHWALVPIELRRDVWRHYRPGQEIDKQPTRRYLEAMRAAIDAVKAAEGR